MPKLSLYRSEKSNDYKFFDKTISEMFSIGATDLYVHKYVGVADQGPTNSLSTPRQTTLDPTKIQDLLFLETRDRKYDSSIYRLRGHYNVQNLDFDLSQFGLFLNNDIIFITVHYNTMIELIGRKLMVGDVLELPHLTDYHPLNETIPVGLRRYYQITDGNFASEGFSNTWYAHLWRIKCEPLVDSQEFSDILSKPTNTDNYLGDWNKTSTYVPGYVVSYGNGNYIAQSNVPAGTPCTVLDPATKTYIPNSPYWILDPADNLKDIIGRYNTNISINDAMIAEATRLLPAGGYDRSQLYLVPTTGPMGASRPAPPVNLVVNNIGNGGPIATRGTVQLLYTGFPNPTPVIRIGAASLQKLFDLSDEESLALQKYININLSMVEVAPERTDTGSGPVQGQIVLAAQATGPITAPYGTVDNTYSDAGQDPSLDSFDQTLIVDTNIMDFRADADPRFRFVKLETPRTFGYADGYMAGDGTAPNGLPTGAGISFPSNPNSGDYFLRTDYLPQILYRYDGSLWIQISTNVRTDTGQGSASTQRGSFINNTNVTTLTDGTTIPELQSLSNAFKITPD
jgi:hypothetical protein